jgi:hypothetical protein
VERSRTLGLPLVAAAAFLSACAGSPHTADPSASATPTTSASSPSISPASMASAAALTAYEGMWQAEQTAALTADYRSPLLEQHATGSALSVLVRGLYSLKLQHLVIRGHLGVHPHITALNPAAAPTTASILDCSDDTHWLVYKAAGGLQNNVPGGHRRITATVTETAGVWKVTTLNTGAEGTC